MKILAIDTATNSCGVALVERAGCIAEKKFVSKETHSRHLMEMIDDVLSMGNFDISDVDGYSVTVGPGSFTGLRIGLSAVKGLVSVTQKPVAAVSALEVLAAPFVFSDIDIYPVIDARKNEVYTGCYRFNSRDESKLSGEEMVVDPEKLLGSISGDALFVGSGVDKYRNLIVDKLGSRAKFAMVCQNSIDPSVLGQLGLSIISSGGASEIAAVVPEYIRKSDAEINYDKNKL